MKMNRSMLMAAMLCLPLQLLCATYHVSPNGNDTNSGLSPAQAWRSIARVNQLGNGLNSGDRILFERGGVYRGTVNIMKSGDINNPIILSSYGSGPKPVIRGSEAVTGWTQWQGNIWRAQVGGSVPYVFVNGELMTMARFPNEGYLRVDQASATSLTDAELDQPNGYWTGATAVIRTTNWSYDVAEVSGFSANTLTHSSTGNNLGGQNWGYFLRNKLSELDMPGEWYHDAQAGYLYLWAPGSTDPNTITVEASTTEHGIYLGWAREHVEISEITFEHQTDCGLRMSGTDQVEVSDCEFRDLFRSVFTTGNNMDFHHCVVERTYGTGLQVIGSGNVVRNSLFQDIAMQPGLGESNWGYHGIRTIGPDNVIRENRFEDIGYIGIVFDENALVEKNLVKRCLAILNDGGGIAFDHCDGAIVRNNIVTDLVGDVSSTATNIWSYYPLSMGIYFGNSNIKNTVVENNTVAHSTNIGIYIDHTMNSVGNEVKGNTLYNNGSGGGYPHRRGSQVRFGDHSNVDGENAVAPYYVPYFDNVFTGNVLVSLNELQDGLAFYHIHTAAWTDFGEQFNNNVYFSPYNDQAIVDFDHFAGLIPYRYTLDSWQTQTGKDMGSNTTHRRLSPWKVNDVIGAELVPNGTFDNNINGWQYQIGDGVISNPTGVLDGGCLGVQFANANGNERLLIDHQNAFNYTQGHFYELKFTTASQGHVDLQVGVKSDDQSWAPEQLTYNAHVGVVPGRKEHSLVFQAPSSGSGRVFFRHKLAEPQYYLDNVSLRRVSVVSDDPLERIILMYNDQLTTQTFQLDGCYHDVHGQQMGSSVTLEPFTSIVLERREPGECGGGYSTFGVRVFLQGAMEGGGLMRDALREQEVLPTTEPYSAMGHPVANPGAQAQPGLFDVTGDQAIVDWVMVELHAPGSMGPVERIAALLRRNGQVVQINGSSVLYMAAPPGQYHLSVQHRNHLSAMTAQPVSTAGETIYDLTTDAIPLYGTEAMMEEGGLRMMWSGDATSDGILRYVGENNDRDGILTALDGMPAASLTGYHSFDTNMDGTVNYTGFDNDRDYILLNLGGTIPTNVRVEQMP